MAMLASVRIMLLFISIILLPLVICYRAGTPGVDYPNYLRAPRTGFECRGRGNGYFSDPDAGCQAYHVCDNGRKYSFVCPVSTLFSDSIKTCDYWYNVKCGGRETDDSERPDIERPSSGEGADERPSVPETEQPDIDQERPEQPAEVGNEPDSGPEPTDDRPDARPDNEVGDERGSTGSTPVTIPPEHTGGTGDAEPDRENEAPVDENADESGTVPDVVPDDPLEGSSSVPNDWRRDSGRGSTHRSHWTTYPSTTTRATKWQTFEGTTRAGDTAPTSSSDSNVIPESDVTSERSQDDTTPQTSSTKEPSSSDSQTESGSPGEFREENWMEQGMPSSSSTSEPGNEGPNQEGNGTVDPVSNVNRYSVEARRRRQQTPSDANDSNLIGSMMKWAAAVNSALSLRQGEPKVTQAGPATSYSEPKGPNPYIPFEDRQRRVRDQTDASVTSSSSTSSPNPPYAYPYEPSVNPSMAISGMHVSLNERKVYTGDRSRKSGDDYRRSSPAAESANHPNPWTFPMTENETAEAAAKPRDTYRARRRDDPFDVSHRVTGGAKTGSAFDMMMANTSSTTGKPSAIAITTPSTHVSGVTERLTEQTKSGTQSKKPGNFITGEVLPNGQCRCLLPDSDVYFS